MLTAPAVSRPDSRLVPAVSPEAPLKDPSDYLVTRLLDEADLAALRAEAFARAVFAGTSFVDSPPPGDEGLPMHWLETARGGPALFGFLNGKATLDGLQRLTGRRWVHVGGSGNYSYYRQPYHFHGLHRDQSSYELSVVTCIHDDPGPGGDLILFPGRTHEPLSAIRETPEEGAVVVRLQPGESLVMVGSAIPHGVTPVGPGRMRITAPAVYHRAPATES